MSNEMDIRRQAEEIVELMPRLMRRLLTVEPEDPAADLPVAQIRVCSLLIGGDRSISCLSRELGITMSATTQLADRLERNGMVERCADEDDRRVRSLCLTQKGRAIMQARKEKCIVRVLQALETLPAADRARLAESLQTLSDVCHQLQENQA